MSGGKARYFLTVILCLAAFAACSPLGSVFDSGGSASDEMWVVPRRHEYRAGESFVPENDLYVYIYNMGMVESVPVSKVRISIITNPNSATQNSVPVPTSGIQLTIVIGTGRKLVKVEYSNFAPATYSIEIRDPLGGSGDGTGEGSGVHVIWK